MVQSRQKNWEQAVIKLHWNENAINIYNHFNLNHLHEDQKLYMAKPQLYMSPISY
jgi:hypothetical protein